MTAEHNPGVTHQEEVLPRALILRTLLGVSALAVLICLGTYPLVRARARQVGQPRARAMEAQVAGQAPHQLAQVPVVRQQVFPTAAAGPSLKERQQQRLEHFGWVDQRQGFIHIPIERAIELVADRGAGGASGKEGQR